MSELSGKTGELRATVTITRKATGKTETFEIVGTTTPEQHEKIVAALKTKEKDDGCNP